MSDAFHQLDAWIDTHFEDEVRYLQALVQVPTDTPPEYERSMQRITLAGDVPVGPDGSASYVLEGEAFA